MNAFRTIWRPTLTDELRGTIRRLEREQIHLALEACALDAKRREVEEKLSYLSCRLAVEESSRG